MMSTIISGIYAIVNTRNRHRYIGSAVDISGRWRQHTYKLRKGTHPSKHLQNAWNKYGAASFDFVILETVKDKNSLIPIEQGYLDRDFPEYNTNRRAGSMFGFRFSEEAKKLMSLIHSGFKHTEESKKKMSEIWAGRPRGKYTEERAAKISAAHKGKKINDNQKRGLAIGQYNPKSAETRKKISDAQKGYKPKKETIEKLKQAWIRRKAGKNGT
ncbi:MAG TPA: GIY-YIG nuclease family protein [Anaerolineales bacterium]|nr:GIY-YIG nuclease family protein [Anaerolineales bacterium]